MPELPELATIVSQLSPIAKLGRSISEVKIYSDSALRLSQIKETNVLIGQKIVEFQRVGKYILILLENHKILFHLAMFGSLTYNYFSKHERVRFSLNTGDFISYNDIRNWGHIYIYSVNEIIPYLMRIGMDPLSNSFTESWLFSSLRASGSLPICDFLVDQTKISGIGNIYRSEILYVAKISPFKKCEDISLPECSALITAISFVLNQAIHYRGSTISDYHDADGNPGAYQNYLRVYGRTGLACQRGCGSVIQSDEMNRKIFHCPKCQK